jgi:Cysteine-rich CPXCG
MLYQKETFINCPYCGESIDILVDDSSGEQSYYEDCSVCCTPILFVLTEDESGEIQVDVRRDDE